MLPAETYCAPEMKMYILHTVNQAISQQILSGFLQTKGMYCSANVGL